MLKTFVLAGLSVFLSAVAIACPPAYGAGLQNTQGPQPVTVAFIGDQGLGDTARAVLQLIKAEGADLVLHQGDLDYDDDPDAWDALITSVLGADFPYFASIGNHDTDKFYGPGGYQTKLIERLSRVAGAHCVGDLGVQSACTYRGLFFILSGVGTIPNRRDDPSHIAFIRDQLARNGSIWRICSWHQNQTAMQLGQKDNEVGWGPYEACRQGGAIIANGNEHSYSRTHLMDSFEYLRVASTSPTLRIGKGKSFAFVSGLGGRSIRDQDQDGAWWAAKYTSDQGADFGALFCTFVVDGKPNRARCHFKDIDGNVADRFDVISDVKPLELPSDPLL